MADSQPDIQVFNQTNLDLPFKKEIFSRITSLIAKNEECSFSLIEVVYVDEDEIVRINKEHLDHDYITDIITFRYDDGEDDIEGTLYCCAPRISEQAEEFEEPLQREFLRIFIHGLLHLTGYKDKSSKQKKQMRAKEETYLDLADYN